MDFRKIRDLRIFQNFCRHMQLIVKNGRQQWELLSENKHAFLRASGAQLAEYYPSKERPVCGLRSKKEFKVDCLACSFDTQNPSVTHQVTTILHDINVKSLTPCFNKTLQCLCQGNSSSMILVLDTCTGRKLIQFLQLLADTRLQAR